MRMNATKQSTQDEGCNCEQCEEKDERIDELEKEVELLQSRMRNFGKSLDNLEAYVEEIEGNMNTVSEDIEFQLSDAERILVNGWQSVNVNKSKNRERAIRIIENFKQYSTVGKKHNFITMKDLCEKIALEEDDVEKVPYATSIRVAEYVVEMSNEAFKMRKVEFKRNRNDTYDDLDGCTLLYQDEPIVMSEEDLI